MVEFSNRRFTYTHDHKWPSEEIDVHHIIVRKSNTKGFLARISAFVLLVNGLLLFLVKVFSSSSFSFFYFFKLYHDTYTSWFCWFGIHAYARFFNSYVKLSFSELPDVESLYSCLICCIVLY